MAEEHVERRLAAILAADVVGYSRLMGQDEAATLSTVRKLRTEVIEPQVAEHQGRLFKVMGDGFLVEFPSVVNAVACAVAIQQTMIAWDAGIPDDRKIELRVGIHLGDVIAEGGDVYGDGVNLAARIEGLAPPGGVAVSAMVHDNIGSRLDLAFEDMGEHQLKNIARPVRVYCLASASRPTTQVGAVERTKPSIAVLPFTNMSGDAEQEYFSDGITEDIITELSRFRNLFVIARNSSFVFKNQAVSVPEVGRKLGVDYVVEGSVRKAGNRVRITAQLIEVTSGNHAWADRYDRNVDDIFAVQDEVTQLIVNATSSRLEVDILQRTARKHPASFAAYEYFLKGIQHQQRFTDADIEIADEMFKRAIELDPQYAEAHAWWAFTDFWRWSRTLDPSCLAVALNKSKKAVELDPQSARSYLGLGHMALYSRQFDLAEASMRQGLILNSNDFHALSNNGLLCAYTGRPADAHTFLEKASQIDPYAPLYLHDYRGMTYFSEGDFENALSALSRPNGGVDNFMYRAACTALLGRKDEAVIWLRKAEQEIPKVSLLQFAKSEPFTDPIISERLVSGLRMAGLPE